MAYAPQTWVNLDVSKPLSAARMTHHEDALVDQDARLSVVEADLTLRGGTYLVDPVAGDDLNHGRLTTAPWRTVAQVNAASALMPEGTEVLFKAGSVNNDAALGPVGVGGLTFGAYGSGADPIFDGRDAAYTGWTLGAGNRYTKTVATDPHSVWIDAPATGATTGYALVRVGSTAAVEATAGTFYYTGTTLHIHTPTSLAPSSHTVHGAMRDVCVYGTASPNCVVEDLDFRYAGSYGAFINQPGWTVRRCSVDRYRAGGVKFQGSSVLDAAGLTECVVEDSLFFYGDGDGGGDGITAPPTTNEMVDFEYASILMQGAASPVIRRNGINNGGSMFSVHVDRAITPAQLNPLNGLSGLAHPGALSTDVTLEGNAATNGQGGYRIYGTRRSFGRRISDNTYYDGLGPGINCGYGSSDLEITYNRLWNLDVSSNPDASNYNGIDLNGFDHPQGTDGHVIAHNVVYNVQKGSCLTLEQRVKNCLVQNNIFDHGPDSEATAYLLFMNHNATGNVFVNNIWRRGAPSILADAAHPMARVFNQEADPDTNTYYTTAAWDALHGADGPYDVDPLWSNERQGDFRLGVGSPAIDTGAVLQEVNDGYIGTAPNVGWFDPKVRD